MPTSYLNISNSITTGDGYRRKLYLKIGVGRTCYSRKRWKSNCHHQLTFVGVLFW